MHYIEHLSRDKKLKKLISQQGVFKLKKKKNICLALCISIMSQQLSTKVAAIFHRRFLDLCENPDPGPEQILKISFESLRSIGLSNAKANYVHNVARFALEKGLDKARLARMSDEEIIAYLSAIKGVGRWTAEMLMMFTLGREDLFAMDDLGLQQAAVKLYRLDNSDLKKFRERLHQISQKWKPYRTYACLYLWGWKDEGST